MPILSVVFAWKPFFPETIHVCSDLDTTQTKAQFAEFSQRDFFTPTNLKCIVAVDGNYEFYKKWPPYLGVKNVVVQTSFLPGTIGTNIKLTVKPNYVYLVFVLLGLLLGVLNLSICYRHGGFNTGALKEAGVCIFIMPLFIRSLCYQAKTRLTNHFLNTFYLKRCADSIAMA